MNCELSGISNSGNQAEKSTMTLLVKRSDPLKTIMMSPTGKKMAEIVRIRPGAICWYQGAASVANITAQLSPLSDWRLRGLFSSIGLQR